MAVENQFCMKIVLNVEHGIPLCEAEGEGWDEEWVDGAYRTMCICGREYVVYCAIYPVLGPH